jgi:hypothetical protein
LCELGVGPWRVTDWCSLKAFKKQCDATLEVVMSAIDWSAIDWVSLIVLSLVVLIAARIGERLSFGSRGLTAVVTAVLFAGGFAIWSYGVDDAVRQVVASVTDRVSG